MRNSSRLMIIILLLGISATFVTRAIARDEQNQEVATLLKKWMEAKDLRDPKVIGEYVADNFVGVGPRGQAMDKRQFVAAITGPDVELKSVDSEEQSLRFHSGGVTVVTGLYKITGKRDSEDITGTYRYVDVVKKTGDRWFIISSTLTRVQEVPARKG